MANCFVGDIQGCYDDLRRLLDLADDLEANRLSDGRTVAHLVVLKLRGLTR